MRQEELTIDMLKERLVTLQVTKFQYTGTTRKRIEGEIRYISGLIQSDEFSTTERLGEKYER